MPDKRTVARRPLHTIALVTPNFNCAAFVHETIESVLQQGYPRLQYVIADGGSTDGSLQIINSYRKHLHTLISGPDGGHADAINRGFAPTSGELMGWINSDDLLHDGALSTVDAIFSAFPEVEWITGIPTHATQVGGNGNSRTQIRVLRGKNFSYSGFLAGNYKWIQQESTFWRRSLWERAGGRLDTSLNLAVDFELWLRFFRHAHLYSVDALLGAFRIREGQRSATQLDEYLAEVDTLISREQDAVKSGEIVAPSNLPRLRIDMGRRARMIQRLRNPHFQPDIPQSMIEAARVNRWCERVGIPTSSLAGP